MTKPQVIVAGAGRDGTVSMYTIIQELYNQENLRAKDTLLNMEACHEYASRECYNSMDAYLHSKITNNGIGDEKILDDLRQYLINCPYDAIIGNGYSFAFMEIPEAFPKDSHFIHLKRRDRKACIDSWIKCCKLFPEANGHYATDESIVYKVWRISAFHLGETSKEDWYKWALDEKCAWYYDRTHTMINEMSKYFPKRMNFYTEDLSDPNKLRELANFIGIDLQNEITPTRKNSFVYADITQIDSFHTPKAQWLFSKFDFPRSVQDDIYAIEYFCERFISWHSYLISNHDKGELERYVLSNLELLKNVRLGIEILTNWETIFKDLEKTLELKLQNEIDNSDNDSSLNKD